jgi:FHS family glucose/mannose:H+ symporter-like MFS transporter
MIRNIKAITASSYLGMFFLGVGTTIVGAAARNIGLSPFQIGLMLAVQNLGFIVSVVLSGALADTHPKPRILLFGSLVLAAAFFAFYLTPQFWLNLIVMLFIGVGIGVYEGVTDAMLLDIHSSKENLHISVNHFFVTLGSIMITVYLIFLQMNWRASVIQAGLVVLGLALFFALTRLQVRLKQGEDFLQRLKLLVREKIVVVLFISTALAVGVELGTGGILTTYLMDLRGFTQTTSKIGLITFLVGVASGRLILGFIAQKEQLAQYLLVLFGGSILIYSALYLFDLGWFTYVAIYLAGISMSALLPMMLTMAGLLYKEVAGTVLGTIKVAIPVGGILLPFFMSLVAKYVSFQASLMVFPLAFVIAFLLLFFTIRSVRSYDIRLSPEGPD